MKHVIKKITASLAAAVMCAAPMASSLSANATISSNARYTFRRVYWIDGSANVKKFEFSYAVKRYHNSPCFYNKVLDQGNIAGGGSAGDTYYSCGGTYTATNYLSGPVVAISAYSDDPAYYEDSFGTCRAYKANGQQSYNSVHYTPSAFLVGDLDNDNDVDDADFQILYSGVSNNLNSSFGYNDSTYVHVGNVSGYYKLYKFDINNDGVLNYDDTQLFISYLAGTTVRFDK